MKLRFVVLTLILCLVVADTVSQIPVPIGPQINTFNSTRVRGYHFTATSSWQLCGLYIPTDNSTGPMNVEFVRFTQGPPPAFAGTTNNFVSLFYSNNVPGTAMISTGNIAVTNANIYGTYGARSDPNNAAMMRNSYGATATVTNVNGTNMTLLRSGMQFPLHNQQMHDIWSEVNYNIGRIIMYHSCCPTPPAPQGPINGPTNVCQGDTVQYWVPWDSIAQSYTWSVGPQDTILPPLGDSIVTVVIGPSSTGDSICVFLNDTCTSSPTICKAYTVSLPPSPSVITGPDTVCATDTATFSIVPIPGVTYNWTLPQGASFASNSNSPTIDVALGASSDSICVSVQDACATSGSVCHYVHINQSPPSALAGFDQNICAGLSTTLQGNNPQYGTGTWSILSGPNSGTILNPNDPASTFENLSPGTYSLEWSIAAPGCPSSNDQVEVQVGISPVADFTAPAMCETVPSGLVNTSQMFGLPTSFRWDMENDGVDNYLVPSPSHIYPNMGVYSVRLIASANGCADTIVKLVNVRPLPNLNITVDDKCDEDAVVFQNNSSIAAGAIASLTYDFGDTSAAVTGNGNFAPQHTYDGPGNYTIQVDAVSSAGCTASQVVDVEVFSLPVPAFAVNNACQFQTTKLFDQSSVVGSEISDWQWDFGDGSSISIDQDPLHDYILNGQIDVVLGVTSDQGCFQDTTITIEIFPTPVAEFNYSNLICLGDTVFLEDKSSIAYGSVDNHYWRVADSIIYTDEDPWHYFPEVGWYSVYYRVTSDKGCVDTERKNVPVWSYPKADFFFESGCAGSPIEFRDSTEYSGDLINWQWKFGSNNVHTSTERHPFHTFDQFGTYDITMEVSSIQGCKSEITAPIKIYENVKPEFSVYPDSGCSPLQVNFADTSKSLSGVGYSAFWHFGDGRVQQNNGQYIYYVDGGKSVYYSGRLVIQTDQGCVTETIIDSSVFVLPQPVANFSTTPDRSELSTQRPLLQFISESTETNFWTWHFGDGHTSRAENPVYQFPEEGDYKVTHIATNIFQCSDTIVDYFHVETENAFYIPSAFTPNGDGKNEFFKVEGLENVTEFTLDIYNRWGRTIYSSTGLNALWDGTDSQGRIVQQGVYMYKISYVDLNGESVNHTGEVSVVGVDK